MKKQRCEVEQAKKRIAEFDRIFKRIYEDDNSGAISHERFLKLTVEYEAGQRAANKNNDKVKDGIALLRGATAFHELLPYDR